MSPLSSDPAAAERQTANLVPGAGAAGPMNDRSLKHGAYSQLVVERQPEKVAEVYAALAADAPLRERDGSLPAADALVVELLAETIVKRQGVSAYLARQEDDGGPPRTSLLEVERRLRQEAARYADQLGLTPQSRSRIGLDLARTGGAVDDLSTILSEPDREVRNRKLIERGRPDLIEAEPVEGQAEEVDG